MQDHIPDACRPDADQQPDHVWCLPELHYPERLNVAVEMVDRHVEEGRGDSVAIYFEGQKLTYSDLRRRTDAFANALLDLGVEPGQRVFVRFPNRPEYVVAVLATQKIGAVPVPSMKLLRAKEVGHVVENSGANVAVVYDDLLPETLEAKAERDLDVGEIVVCDRTGRDHDHHSFDEMIDGADTSLSTYDARRDDAALLAYTSGTTGRPKGTLHTHSQMMAICDGYARYCLDPREDDVFTSNAPIAFTFGYGVEVAFPFRFGASTVLIQDAEPEDLLAAVDEFDVTILAAVPTGYNQMLSRFAGSNGAVDVSSLRLGITGGASLPRTTYEEAKERLGIKVLEGIGTTELLHNFISHRHDDEVDPTATGYPVPGYECRVVDPDTGEELNRGEAGLLQVRGPTGVTYWDRSKKQRQAVSEGWSAPGDIFVHREDGYFEHKSRQDDLIITSGYNVPGPEVEDVLQEREEVYEVAVIGSPDEERGAVVKAIAVLAEGYEPSADLTETLQNHVKQRIAPYKYPREVEYTDELPKTETGKIRRKALREQE